MVEKSKKGLLFVLGGWGIGGVERVTITLANAFVARHWRVVIVFFREEDATLLAKLDPKVMVKKLSFPVNTTINEKALRLLLMGCDIGYIVNQWCLPYRVTRFLRRASHGLGVRLISVHHNIPNNNGRIAAAKNALQRCIWRLLSAMSLRCVYQKSDAYVVLSKRFEGIFQAFTRLRSTPKLKTITNPLTLLPEATLQKENVLLYVGRLEESQKRVSRVINIWQKLVSMFPEWRLEIVGDGPDRARYEEQAKGLDRITFHGAQDPTPFYAKAKLLLLTSDFEGFPLVLAEAMAATCVPIVYGSYPAAYDIVRGTNGVVVAPPFDCDTFVQIIGDLIACPEIITSMARVGAKTVSTFGIEAILDQWEQLFCMLNEKGETNG